MVYVKNLGVNMQSTRSITRDMDSETKKIYLDFIKNNSFATLISAHKDQLHISHINLIIDESESDRIVFLGHLSAGNPQAKQLNEVSFGSAIFKESSSAESNTLALHVHGKMTKISDENEVMAMLSKLIAKYESGREPSWMVEWNEEKFKTQMKGIVAFKFEVSHMESITLLKELTRNSIPVRSNASSLYCPKHFKEERPGELEHFITKYPKCIFLTYNEDGLGQIAHMNLAVLHKDEKVYLQGRIPACDGQLDDLKKTSRAVAVFMGPHSYISPTWYSTPYSVPTWNYATAHVHGILNNTQAEIVNGEAVISFELAISRIDGKFKLNQNRTLEDRVGVIEGLAQSGRPAELEVQGMMCKYSRN